MCHVNKKIRWWLVLRTNRLGIGTGVVSLHNAPVNNMVEFGEQNDAKGTIGK
jgi:hypothetical protein